MDTAVRKDVGYKWTVISNLPDKNQEYCRSIVQKTALFFLKNRNSDVNKYKEYTLESISNISKLFLVVSCLNLTALAHASADTTPERGTVGGPEAITWTSADIAVHAESKSFNLRIPKYTTMNMDGTDFTISIKSIDAENTPSVFYIHDHIRGGKLVFRGTLACGSPLTFMYRESYYSVSCGIAAYSGDNNPISLDFQLVRLSQDQLPPWFPYNSAPKVDGADLSPAIPPMKD